MGDELLSKDRQLSKIKSITKEGNSKTVYNFEVEDNHNYYVSEYAILVHNNCDFPMKPSSFGDKLDMQYFYEDKIKKLLHTDLKDVINKY
ncbi:hypothetical protein KO535_02970 [Chryseobacterium sp. NKUCC03_KSP]|nr:hypothetical protein [Chryseobacterium sp. NKUCC03_KSP]